MAKHRAGDRRIMSISIPEKLAERLDRRVGKGRNEGRSATIAKMIQESLDGQSIVPPSPSATPKSAGPITEEVRIEEETMGSLEVPAERYMVVRRLVRSSISTLEMIRCPVGSFVVLEFSTKQQREPISN